MKQMNTISHYIRNSYSAQQNFGVANNNAESVTKQQKQQVRDIRRMLNCADQDSSGADFFSSKSQSILDSSKSYSDSLRNQRQQAKDTSLSLKKLKYQHKSISSKILRAKTSAAAKQAVSSAKREVIKLKRQRLDPDCDKEELEAAISHAKDMERVAQKKARHLELEELAKATGCVLGESDTEDTSSLEPDRGNSDENIDEVMDIEDEASSGDSLLEPIDIEETDSEIIEISDLDMVEELTSEVMEDLSEGMKEMLEEMGFGEISEDLEVYSGNMSDDDIKKMEIKHRNSEMKDIVKADADYLKVVFEHFQESIDVSV